MAVKNDMSEEQPCLIPTLIGKGSETKLPATMCAHMFVWKSFRMAVNLGGQPHFERIIHTYLLMVSQALVRSVKAMNRWWFCALRFSSEGEGQSKSS